MISPLWRFYIINRSLALMGFALFALSACATSTSDAPVREAQQVNRQSGDPSREEIILPSTPTEAHERYMRAFWPGWVMNNYRNKGVLAYGGQIERDGEVFNINGTHWLTTSGPWYRNGGIRSVRSTSVTPIRNCRFDKPTSSIICPNGDVPLPADFFTEECGLVDRNGLRFAWGSNAMQNFFPNPPIPQRRGIDPTSFVPADFCPRLG